MDDVYSFSRRWYVVQTQPGREEPALLHLRRQGFVTFCPMRFATRGTTRNRVTALSPFFRGYVFIALDLERERWRSINGTIGVMRLVAFGNAGRPAPLPTGFVEQLQQMSEAGGGLGGGTQLGAGDAVRIIEGPFDQLCGVLEKASNQDRVTVLLSLLGKETRVQLQRRVLIAA